MGSTRFTGGGIGKVHGGGSVFGSYVVCGMGFQQIWRPTFSSPPHFLISPSLSWDWIWRGSELWSRSWVYFICFWFLTNLKNSFAVCVEKGYSGFVGSWKDYLLCGLRRDLLVWWKGVFWVYEWEFVGFVKRGFSGFISLFLCFSFFSRWLDQFLFNNWFFNFCFLWFSA